MRIIIDNRSNYLSDAEATLQVGWHMRQPAGVPDRTYLAAAWYQNNVVVLHVENKKSHRFVVQDLHHTDKAAV